MSLNSMASPPDLRETVLAGRRTSNRVTLYFFEHLPPRPLGRRRAGGASPHHPHDRRSHSQFPLHLAQDPRRAARIPVPPMVDRHRVGAGSFSCLAAQRQRHHPPAAARRCDHGGTIPPTRSYIWRNLPLDVGHVLGYFIAHEGHHRGQIVLVARALGQRLPGEFTAASGSGRSGRPRPRVSLTAGSE